MSEQIFGEGAELALALVTASMNANFDTIDRLYEREREHRMALEVHIDEALHAFARAWGGTVREYEGAVAALRELPYGARIESLAARHCERVSA